MMPVVMLITMMRVMWGMLLLLLLRMTGDDDGGYGNGDGDDDDDVDGSGTRPCGNPDVLSACGTMPRACLMGLGGQTRVFRVLRDSDTVA